MPSLAGGLARRPSRSSAVDDLIMGTNSPSVVSKRSVERLYHPDEPHFFRYFVKKFQRRSPLINRGYWLRLKVIDCIVRQFLTGPSSHKRVVINLGCGSDVLPWQCHTRHRDVCGDALFVDVDYPGLIRKKRDTVLQTPQLRELLGPDFALGESEYSGLMLRSAKYCQVGCDLRELEVLRSTLESFLNLSECAVLFVAEDSVTYMDTHSADSLIHWASSIGQAEFCLLEQILPHGPDHPFAQTMLSHFNNTNTPPRSIYTYPTLEEQRARFQSRGWARAETWDLWQAWSSDKFLSTSERAALDELEPFDEWEDFMLFARHYFVMHASTVLSGEQGQFHTPALAASSIDGGPQVEIGITSHCLLKTPKRRFGNTMTVSNAMGQPFVLHMMGMGANSKSDTYDVYSLDHSGTAPKLPLTGPLPRMCYTVTDLGEFGVLLVGGRGLATSALSDCWIFEKGANSRWRTAPSLPTPLFRHAAIRLGNSSLALVVGGKVGSSQISEDCLVFHPEKGWLSCQVAGTSPKPAFGAVLCHSSGPSANPGVFCGLLAGGISRERTVVSEKYLWQVDMTGSQPVVTFRKLESRETETNRLSLFGAFSVNFGLHSVVCGGMGQDASLQGQAITIVEVTDKGFKETQCRFNSEKQSMPFMIGCSLTQSRKSLVIVGGGATCFSMGAFWETGMYQIDMSHIEAEPYSGLPAHEAPMTMECMASHRVTNVRQEDNHGLHKTTAKATMATIPRLSLSSERGFEDVLRARQPVIIEGLELGDCLGKWTPEYMTGRVGEKQEVVAHECRGDTEMMDFTSKNFRYVTDTFGNVMRRMQAGGRLYLRSLSQEKSSELPANIEDDFPLLAKDFCLPGGLDFVKERLFSSILRASGRVNMWLHYDVMANVYVQISGSKRMVLFPPGDVTSLSFAPGASSSSIDVFSSLEAGELAGTHPHEAMLYPGDVLLLPAVWPHTSTPTTDMSIAVNVFFRDLESGYAQGRDVYGNRDLAAYEKGRREAARIVKTCQPLPADTRRFYLGRIADELRQAAEGGT